MKTTTLVLSTSLDAVPSAVFESLTDSEQHSAFTRSRSQIDAIPGGRFSYFNGAVSGEFETLNPPHGFIQRLRARTWPAHHSATVTSSLANTDGGAGTRVNVVETGVPSEQLDEVIAGWNSYWDALNAFLRERKLDVVRRFVAEYKNRQNPDIVDDLVSDDCRVHIPLPDLPPGREGVRRNGQMMCDAFPDVQVEREFS